MFFAVVWLDNALDDVADFYVTADLPTQARVSDALEALNRRLAKNPFDEGESRDGGERITFVPHLAIRFRIDQADQVVRVTAAKPYGRAP